MRTYQDRLIDGAGSCPLAIREYGGSGTPVLLLHGATRTLADWEPIARDLVRRHRVIAMELRNHGRSGDGPWTWDAVLNDIRRAMAATGLERPAIVGHSLGGMIAALYSASGGDCLCAVNLDGYGKGRVDQYPGIAPEDVQTYWRGLIAGFRAKRPDAAGPIGSDEMRAHRAAVDAEAVAFGIPDDVAASGFERSIKKLPGERYVLRPDIGSFMEMNAAISETDWFAAFRRVTSPILIYNCIGPEPAATGSPSETQPMMAAYRAGLRRDLAVLADETSRVSVRTLDANHMLIVNMPETVSAQIHHYIESIAERTAG